MIGPRWRSSMIRMHGLAQQKRSLDVDVKAQVQASSAISRTSPPQRRPARVDQDVDGAEASRIACMAAGYLG